MPLAVGVSSSDCESVCGAESENVGGGVIVNVRVSVGAGETVVVNDTDLDGEDVCVLVTVGEQNQAS